MVNVMGQTCFCYPEVPQLCVICVSCVYRMPTRFLGLADLLQC